MGTASPIFVLATLAVALLVAGFDAAAARPCDDDINTIRLPTGAGGLPWECCDWVEKHPTFRPGKWRCNDVVDKCSADCHHCKKVEGGDGYVCRDWVISLRQPPVCTPRPWDCCDNAGCTRSIPPICWCADEVESCPSNCNSCELVESSDPPRYRCLDSFKGFPGPTCSGPRMSERN